LLGSKHLEPFKVSLKTQPLQLRYRLQTKKEIEMETTSPPQDISMMDGQTPPVIPSEEPKFGGFTRFEIELEV
jgi:hypothetical protein